MNHAICIHHSWFALSSPIARMSSRVVIQPIAFTFERTYTNTMIYTMALRWAFWMRTQRWVRWADELEVPQFCISLSSFWSYPPKALGVVGTYHGIVHSPTTCKVLLLHKGSFTTYRLSFFYFYMRWNPWSWSRGKVHNTKPLRREGFLTTIFWKKDIR
jgi:hypothetical protein